MWVRGTPAILAGGMALVGVVMLRNTGTGDNRLFWKTFGVIVIALAGLVACLA
jgi:FtsH-binding integral membrane protein